MLKVSENFLIAVNYLNLIVLYLTIGSSVLFF